MKGSHEFRQHWRALFAATLGLASGTGLTISTASLFAPALISEFGWERAEFALLGTLGIAQILIVPFVGWLTDLFGVKRIAVIGIVCLPFAKFACSMMDGSLMVYFALVFFQMTIGTTNSALVYTRLVSLNFKEARGLALSIVASGGAFLLIFAVPALNWLIDTHGWRSGFVALGAFTAISGVAVLLMIPKYEQQRAPDAPAHARRRVNWDDYRQITRSSFFWLLAGGLALVNGTHVLTGSQFKLVLMDQQISSATASWLISLYGITVMCGRFLCGFSVDRLPPNIVAFVALGLPTIGLFLLASPLDTLPVVAVAIVLMGLAQGAEIDLMAYLAARHFEGRVYGSVVGLISAGMALSSTLGAVLLSVTLRIEDHFSPYLYIMALTTAVGASLFLFLRPPAHVAVAEPKHA